MVTERARASLRPSCVHTARRAAQSSVAGTVSVRLPTASGSTTRRQRRLLPPLQAPRARDATASHLEQRVPHIPVADVRRVVEPQLRLERLAVVPGREPREPGRQPVARTRHRDAQGHLQALADGGAHRALRSAVLRRRQGQRDVVEPLWQHLDTPGLVAVPLQALRPQEPPARHLERLVAQVLVAEVRRLAEMQLGPELHPRMPVRQRPEPRREARLRSLRGAGGAGGAVGHGQGRCGRQVRVACAVRGSVCGHGNADIGVSARRHGHGVTGVAVVAGEAARRAVGHADVAHYEAVHRLAEVDGHDRGGAAVMGRRRCAQRRRRRQAVQQVGLVRARGRGASRRGRSPPGR